MKRIEDIKVSPRRSIRDIPIEKQKRPHHNHGDDVLHDDKHIHVHKIKDDKDVSVSPYATSIKTEPSKSRGGKSFRLRWLFLILGVIVLFSGIGYIASVYFARASFTMVPNIVTEKVKENFIAESVSTSKSIRYEEKKVSITATTSVPSTLGKKVSTKAKGSITIYNSFSKTSQTLVAGTRFTNDSGKLYLLTSSVVIPGYKGTTSITPGSVNATLEASQPGLEYNIGGSSNISDFKIVAYKNTTKYNKIYGRQTTSFTGGYVGYLANIDSKLLEKTAGELKTQIVSSALTSAKSDIDPDQIIYDTLYLESFQKVNTSILSTTTSQVSLTGNITVLALNKKDLVSKLVKASSTKVFDGFEYDIDLSKLTVNMTSSHGKPPVAINIEGDISLIGKIDTETIKKGISGLYSKEVTAFLTKYKPVIKDIKGQIMPPWSMVPYDLEKINIEIDY
jgi:hypothetical protein